ncbi:hypothetical protein [Bartonella sp. B1098]|uniref:hypothetical protein n=1 Tax=Bartonella sp. B1098 TaxID=2911421 RepID=UPI0020C38972|nr:hypothetical protein [Bartonella sp. B1098]
MFSSILGATGNIGVDARKEAIVTASHMIADQDINETGQSVTIDDMTDHHSSHLQTYEKGFVLIWIRDFVSIYGSEGKSQNEEGFEHQGPFLNGKNITIIAKKDDITVYGCGIPKIFEK